MIFTICYTCGAKNTDFDIHCMTCDSFLKPCDINNCQTCINMERRENGTCFLCDLEGDIISSSQLVFAWKCDHSCCIHHLIEMTKAYGGRLGGCSICRNDAMCYDMWILKTNTADDERIARELMEQERQQQMRLITVGSSRRIIDLSLLDKQDEQIIRNLLREDEDVMMANERDAFIAQQLYDETIHQERMILDDFNIARQLQERDVELYNAIQNDEEFARRLQNETM